MMKEFQKGERVSGGGGWVDSDESSPSTSKHEICLSFRSCVKDIVCFVIKTFPHLSWVR